MKQLLLVKMSSLGDVVHALPAVSDAIAHGWQVDWVVEEAFADVARAHPGVRTVIPIAWRRWRKSLTASRAELKSFDDALRAVHYDCVLDSQGLIKSAVVALRARGPSAGFSHTSAREPLAAFAYRRGYAVARAQHAIARQRQLFAAALDYPLTDDGSALEFGASNAASQQVLLLHGTTWASKHWPLAMWQELVQLIKASGYEPVVTWGDEVERARAQELVAAGATLLDRQPLATLITHMAEMAAVITVDSGLGHLAAVLGRPTVGLYGATSGLLTGVQGEHSVVLQGEISCAPCLRKECRYRGTPLEWQGQVVEPPCFASVPPDQVWTAARKLMASA
ncbi:MAG: lipopolysaccharide heptosyltransferase I [Pseudomonadales bacterium]